MKKKQAVKQKMFKVVTETTIRNVYYVPAQHAAAASFSVVLNKWDWDDTQQQVLNEAIKSCEKNTDKVKLIKGPDGGRIYVRTLK